MTRTPQVIVTLSPEGRLQAELPGANGSRRKVELREPEADLLRILRAQLTGQVEIGADGAPTQAQVRHWERHEMFPDPRCPFCRNEAQLDAVGKALREAREPRPRPVVLAEHGGVVVRRVPAGRKGRRVLRTSKSATDLGL